MIQYTAFCLCLMEQNVVNHFLKRGDLFIYLFTCLFICLLACSFIYLLIASGPCVFYHSSGHCLVISFLCSFCCLTRFILFCVPFYHTGLKTFLPGLSCSLSLELIHYSSQGVTTLANDSTTSTLPHHLMF